MSHKDKVLSHREKKKAAITARNKRDNRVNIQADFHEDSLERERNREDELREEALAAQAARGDDGEVVWSARLQEVRNKLNGKKRMASDRWNRFAGTAGGGGRGR